MKNRLALSLAAIVAVALLITPAYSQTLRVRANIPFAFTANGIEMPAGIYDLRGEDAAISWSTAGRGFYTLAGIGTMDEKVDRPCLIFQVYGDHYVLAKIVSGQQSRLFPQGKQRQQLARDGKAKEIAILLYPIH